MINYDNVTKKTINKHNLIWPQIPDAFLFPNPESPIINILHGCRILIIGDSGSGK